MMNALKVPLRAIEAKAPRSTVCVTGASGYVAGPIVERLLAAGHTVHATVRDPSKEASVAHLKAMPGASERLKLFKADLLASGSYDEAVAGCDYVLHTASPYVAYVKPDEVHAKLLGPAVQGTKNVLESVNKTASVKRVVLTSSCAAVCGNPTERGAGHVFSEDDWAVTPSDKVLTYWFSKVAAERAGWEVAKTQDRWQLVVVNPGVVLGPPTSAQQSGESVALMQRIMGGELSLMCPKLGFGIVDVRDVAAAHCLAMVTPGAQGRYITVRGSALISDLVKVAAKLYPNKVSAPWLTAPKWLIWLLGPAAAGMSREDVTHTVNFIPEFNHRKIELDLGMTWTPLEDTVRDMVETMKEMGQLKK